MNRFTICVLTLSLGLLVWPFSGFAQSSSGTGQSSTDEVKPSIGFDTSEFPLWAKDLRRAEIVAFGSFPFTMFFTTFAMDTWRCASHDWDPLYAPWPVKPPGAINMTQDELKMTMAISAAISAAIAITDFSIIKIKRYKEKKRIQNLPAGSPIIITQNPSTEAEAGASAEAGADTKADAGASALAEPESSGNPQTEASPPPVDLLPANP
jgi:hypothetical protein